MENLSEALLKRSALFRALSIGEGSIAWLEQQTFENGAVVFNEGEMGDRFYFILSGIACLSRKEEGENTLITRLDKGHYFGLLPLIRNEPRTVTVHAEGTLQVASLKSEKFLSLYDESPELREQIAHLKGVYQLPCQGGILTLHAGQFMEMDSLTAMCHFSKGVKIASTKVTGKPIFSMSRVGESDVTPITYKHHDIHRELFLKKNKAVGITAIGEWSDLGRVHALISKNQRVWPWQLALFRQTGELWLERERDNLKKNAIICQCTHITRQELNEAVAEGYNTIEKLATHTSVSQICGSCTPKLSEFVGITDMEDMELIEVITVTDLIKSFRFRCQHTTPSLPGQHICIEAKIGGTWIQRFYTLTSPAHQQEYYEITVKREKYGLFSRWIHDKMTENSYIRASKPKGHYYLSLELQTPVVCFVAGIGMTPALSMLRTLYQTNSHRILYIDYSVSQDFAYLNEFTECAQQHDNIKINLRTSSTQGHIQYQEVKEVAQKYPEATFYICGPKSFEETMLIYLNGAHILSEQIEIEDFSPNPASMPKFKGRSSLLLGSLLSFCLVILFTLLGYLFTEEIYWHREKIWLNDLWKPLTGYTLVVLTVIMMTLSLRKRWRYFIQFGDVAQWQLIHIFTGLLALCVLFIHTGFLWGTHFHLLLMLSFLGTLFIGSWLGIINYIEKPLSSPHFKDRLTITHLAFFWPLPTLLGIHIFLAYY